MSREQREKFKGGGGGRDREDSAPRFSMFSDSESPLEERNKDKVEVEIKLRLTKVLSLETEETENIPPAESGFSEAIDKPEQVKVKLQGRRMLCKASDRDSANSDDLQQPFDGPSFDFDSPVPQKNHGGGTENEDMNAIRDILNKLNSRLKLLSIEKKRPTLESSHLDAWKSSKAVEIKNKEEAEYTSAGSSFSASPELPDNSSVNESETLGGSRAHITLKEKDLQIGVQNHGQDCPERIDCDEDDDECVILSDQNHQKKFDHGERDKQVNDVGTSKTKYDVGESADSKENAPFILTGSRFSYNLPREIAKILYPHQVDGLKWLWSLHCQEKGGILGDDMGLGKTMQICVFLAGLFRSRLIKRALIVAPKTLLSHWIKELAAVGLSEKAKEYFGTNVMARHYELDYVLKNKGILLTTYDIVRNNSKSLRGYSYYKDDDSEDRITWDYMILDEGHLIKNPSTQRAKSLLEIPSAHRIIISGTTIQNNLMELWALFKFCRPELLGDKKEFKEKYEYRILRGNDKKALDREKRIGSTAAKDLRERIQPYFLRRLKSEVFLENDDSVAKLSKKNEQIVWLRLTSRQRQLYEAYLKLFSLSSVYDSPLPALTILKKICDHPLLLTKRAAEDVLEGMDSMTNPEDVQMAEKLASYIADVDVVEKDGFLEKNNSVSCKISFIMTLLDKLIPDGHNVLIFSQTRKMLNLIQESLESSGYDYLRIDGTTKAEDRIKIVNDFQEGVGASIFLLTSQVGGLGLTLTKADRVIIVDPSWNPSTDNQSVDRAYRIGQRKDVVVYRLMTCGTVEEKIYRKQIFKGGLFKTVTEHKEQTRYFSRQDLRELFSLPREGFDISVTQRKLQEEHDRQHQMNESLKSHIEFLMTLGIAGVSNHSLLYSKTSPVQAVEEVEEITDADALAYHPNERSLLHLCKSKSQIRVGKRTERLIRISQMLGNQVMISRFPDKWEKLKQQMIDSAGRNGHRPWARHGRSPFQPCRVGDFGTSNESCHDRAGRNGHRPFARHGHSPFQPCRVGDFGTSNESCRDRAGRNGHRPLARHGHSPFQACRIGDFGTSEARHPWHAIPKKKNNVRSKSIKVLIINIILSSCVPVRSCPSILPLILHLARSH